MRKKDKYPFMRPSQTDRRDRPCDLATRRRVIVDRHLAAEQPDGEEVGRDDRQRTEGRELPTCPNARSVRDSTVTGSARPTQ